MNAPQRIEKGRGLMFDLSSLIMPPDKVALRRNTIGASDMPVIMGDNEERLLNLWKFKRGGEQDDLSDVLPVMLGLYTEPFNLALLAKRAGLDISPATPAKRGIMSASPDAYAALAEGVAVVDAKHCGPYKSEADLGTYYVPQLFAQMHVTGCRKAVLSVIRGNSDFFWLEYDWCDEYGARVVEAAERFYECVQTGKPPCAVPAEPTPKPVGIVEYDMTLSNEWPVHAASFIETELAADRHEIAKKALKALVPDDASKCFGHGITINRDKRGALRFAKGE